MFVEFLRAFLLRWANLVTGGIIVGFVWFWEKVYPKQSVSDGWNLLLAFLFIGIAAFLAWKEKAVKVRQLEGKLEHEEARRIVRDELGKLLESGGVWMNVLKTELDLNNTTATGIMSNSGAIEKCIAWDKEATAFIGSSLGNSYVTRFSLKSGSPLRTTLKS